MAELTNLSRGGKRLVLGAVALWFVFWTVAYVLKPYSSLKPEPSFAVRVGEWSVLVPCIIAAAVFGSWIALGFHPEPGDATAPGPQLSARLQLWLKRRFASQTAVRKNEP